jgi:hypothetical protein
MDELVKRLMETADVGEDVAKKVVATVSDFMKEKLPGGVGDQMAGFLSGGLGQVGGLADKASDIAKNFSDILGGKK